MIVLKRFLATLILCVPAIANAQEIYLDCTVTYTSSSGKATIDVNGKQSVIVPGKGDTRTWEIDIDLDDKTAEVPSYSSKQFVDNSNDPKQNLSISKKSVVLGTFKGSSYWYAAINRDNLSFSQIGKNVEGVYGGKGECVVVEERAKPKGF